MIQNCYNMLIVSINSLLRNNDTNIINFYFVYDEYFDITKFEYLFKKLKSFANVGKIEMLKVENSKYSKLAFINAGNCLYIFELVEKLTCDKVLYLAPYTLIISDITKLYSNDCEYNSTLATEYIYSDDLENFSSFPILNPTILLINVKKWKENNYFKKLFLPENISALIKQKDSCVVYYFNLIINDYELIEPKYNYTEPWRGAGVPISCTKSAKKANKSLQMHLNRPVIITFLGTLPVSKGDFRNSYFNLWWKYAEKTEIYKDIKEY